ncbi:MAG: hypothetical protein ABIV47_22500 [Roseiflexaceae bacterium]
MSSSFRGLPAIRFGIIFERRLHACKGMAAQLGRQGIGQVGLKAGDPDAVNLLLELCNGRYEHPVGVWRFRHSVYPVTAKTG